MTTAHYTTEGLDRENLFVDRAARSLLRLVDIVKDWGARNIISLAKTHRLCR